MDELKLLRQLSEKAEVLDAQVEEKLSAPFDHPEEPESEGGLGVREPRRPAPSGLSDVTALPQPDSDEDA